MACLLVGEILGCHSEMFAVLADACPCMGVVRRLKYVLIFVEGVLASCTTSGGRARIACGEIIPGCESSRRIVGWVVQ
jgi:hypothetical protein